MVHQTIGRTSVGSSGVNGDTFHVFEEHNFIMLADGASGSGSEGKQLMGKICTETALEGICKEYLSVESMLDAVFWEINNALIKESQNKKENIYGTLVLCCIESNCLTVASIGDSPTYYFNSSEIKRIAKSERKYEWMIREGHITRPQYENYITSMHPWMWSCFDTFIPMVVPNHRIEKVFLNPGDIVTVCSDGVSDWVSPEEMYEEISKHALNFAIENLLELAKVRAIEKQAYYDDMTLVVIKVQ